MAKLDKRRTVTDVLEIARRLQAADPDIEFAGGKMTQQGQSHTFNIKVPPMSRLNVELTWTSAGGPRDLDIVGGGNQRKAGDKPESVTLFNMNESPAVTTFTVKDVDTNALASEVSFTLRLYDDVWTTPQTVAKAFYIAKPKTCAPSSECPPWAGTARSPGARPLHSPVGRPRCSSAGSGSPRHRCLLDGRLLGLGGGASFSRVPAPSVG